MTDRPTHYFYEKGEQLSGVEYVRLIREQDANFQAALREAYMRGEFPGQAMRDAA